MHVQSSMEVSTTQSLRGKNFSLEFKGKSAEIVDKKQQKLTGFSIVYLKVNLTQMAARQRSTYKETIETRKGRCD